MHATEQIYAKEITNDWYPDDFSLDNFPSFLFELDTFQKQGFYLLDKHHSVFVAAHTSSGKTLLAHFCIWKALQNGTKVIYTSPIKALSNQKYYEFRQRYSKEKENIGIITGDVQINEDASILIMTTEILRNRLYRDDIKDLEYVIFDEVHYLNDKERGVVWEECIIQLKPSVTLLFLSATISNALEFSEWVGRINNKTIYVIKTNKRVVPLTYICFRSNGDFFNLDGKPINTEKKIVRKTVRKAIKNEINLETFIRKIKVDSLPTIFFCFSKRKCEEYMNACSSMSYTDMQDRKKILHFLEKNKIVSNLKKYWLKGIAVHHSGLLPSEKETVEMLFSSNLLKILFATETMAMGLNMPAKSVVFLSPFKAGRKLTTTELLQMSGRAGRRGIDAEGKVYISCDRLNHEELRQIIYGKPAPLVSTFRLTFNLVLMLSKSNFEAHEYMKRSFSELYLQRISEVKQDEIRQIEEKLENMKTNATSDVKEFVSVLFSINCIDFIDSAKWVINHRGHFGYIDAIKNNKIVIKESTNKYGTYTVSVPFTDSGPIEYIYESLDFDNVFLVGDSATVSWNEAVHFIQKRKPEDYILYLKQYKILKKIEKLQKLVKALVENHASKDILDLVNNEIEFFLCNRNLNRLKSVMSDKNLVFGCEYEKRIRFLEDKGYIKNGKLLLKGHVASEIRTLNDVLVTEMLFNNEFNKLCGEEILSLFSCMISNEREMHHVAGKSKDIKVKYGEESPDHLSQTKTNINIEFLNILENYENNYNDDMIEYKICETVSLNYSAVKPVYLWCKNYPFSSCVDGLITKGGFVRIILRLHESIREMKTACQLMENTELYNKLETFERILLRDVIVEQSLYLKDNPLT